MEKEIVGHCPVCNEKLIATNLICKNCNVELKADFHLSKFNYLTNTELKFIEDFLVCQGSFKALQQEKGLSYPAAKKKLSEVLKNLGFEINRKTVKEESQMAIPANMPVSKTDDIVIERIKHKLNQCGGRTRIRLFQGDSCEIWFSPNGKGLESSKIPIPNQLMWEAFTAAVELVMDKGGRAKKGNARAGKLGSSRLPLDSVEGYVAHKVHGVEKGESAFGPGFVICAVLDWAGICKNERGCLSINPQLFTESDR